MSGISTRNGKINLFILLLTIVAVIAFFPHKQLYFDESHSIMTSKGISLANIEKVPDTGTITSADLAKFNNLADIYYTGSGLHGIGLAYFSDFFNNTLSSYVAFSALWGVLALIVLYFLCGIIFGDSIFTGVALLLYITDLWTLNTMYFIRPYMMCVCLVICAGYFFFRYLFRGRSPWSIFFLSLFSTACVCSHYFTFYIILVYVLAILYHDRLKFFSLKNILAIILALPPVIIYLYPAKDMFGLFGRYQVVKGNLLPVAHIGVWTFASLFFKNVAINFKMVYPLFRDILIVRLTSFLFVVFIYIFGLHMIGSDSEQRKKFNLLFLLGIFSCVFLAPLAYYTQNTILFSFRYFLFSIPFCSVFVAYFFKLTFENVKLNMVVKIAFVVILLSPGLYQFIINRTRPSGLPCNQVTIARDILKSKAQKVEVPDRVDAVFINSLLPHGYKIDYLIKPGSNDLVIYNNDGTTETLPLLRNSIVLLY